MHIQPNSPGVSPELTPRTQVRIGLRLRALLPDDLAVGLSPRLQVALARLQQIPPVASEAQSGRMGRCLTDVVARIRQGTRGCGRSVIVVAMAIEEPVDRERCKQP